MTIQDVTPRTNQSLVDEYGAEQGLNGAGVYQALAQTIFPKPGDATLERVNALLIVARQYNLSPWTREIYAFPAKGKGIVPIVSVDGWMKLVNGHPDCEGIELSVAMESDDKTPISATCRIHRKGWKVPTEITEYVHEVRRNTEPWRQQPVRMIRHRAFIQAARLAFGFGGIYEADEAARFASDTTGEVRETNADVIEQMNEAIASVDDEPQASGADEEAFQAALDERRRNIERRSDVHAEAQESTPQGAMFDGIDYPSGPDDDPG